LNSRFAVRVIERSRFAAGETYEGRKGAGIGLQYAGLVDLKLTGGKILD
jgi:hypothetical protein